MADEQQAAPQAAREDASPIDFSNNPFATRFSELVGDMRAAVIRDFSELAPNIYIIDSTKPIDEEIARAAAQLGIPNLRERITRQIANGASILTNEGMEGSGGIELPFRREDSEDALTDITRDSSVAPTEPTDSVDYSTARSNFNAVVIFPSYPSHIARINSEDGFHGAIITLMHETGHALSLIHPEFNGALANLAENGVINKLRYDQFTETFANTFAYDVGSRSGLLPNNYIDYNMALLDVQTSNPHLMLYNATDEFGSIRSRHSTEDVSSAHGLPNLRDSFNRSLAAQNLNLSTSEIVQSIRLDQALEKADGFYEAMSNSRSGRAIEGYLGVDNRHNAAINHITSRYDGANPDLQYNPPPREPIDALRTAANLWLYDQPDVRGRRGRDNISDEEITNFTSSILNSYVNDAPSLGNSTSITPSMIEIITKNVDNDVWAQQFLNGIPIDRAIIDGIQSIEGQEGHGLNQSENRAPRQSGRIDR